MRGGRGFRQEALNAKPQGVVTALRRASGGMGGCREGAGGRGAGYKQSGSSPVPAGQQACVGQPRVWPLLSSCLSGEDGFALWWHEGVCLLLGVGA